MILATKLQIYRNAYLKYDFMSGLVVFLIAIPLCLGIALAAGAPLISGLISGIIGGIIVGFLSESPVSVSGPAAGMVAVILAAIAQLGSFHDFLTALVLAGILQIVFGFIRAGFIADYIPSNVIQGLLCAIGILIIIKQLPLAFTHPTQDPILQTTLRDVAENLSLKPLVHLLTHLNLGAAIISLLSILLLISADTIKINFFKKMPAPIIVVILGVIVNEIFIVYFSNLSQTTAYLVNIPIQESLKSFFLNIDSPTWSALANYKVYFFAFSIAAVASVETLLNLEASEKIDPGHRYSSRNRELIAQGVGNFLAGLLGGIPITSVVVRSSVNIQSGAKTKMSTIFHGIFILVAITSVPALLNHIPLASLAAILIYVGYKLTKVSIYKKMFHQGFERFFPFVVTVIAIVFTNLLLGICIGLFVSFFYILKLNSQTRLNIIKEMHPAGTFKRIILPPQVSFLNKAALIAQLNNITPKSNLIIDAHYSKYIDRDIVELIKDFKNNQAVFKGINLTLTGFKESYEIHGQTEFISVTTYDVQASLTPDAVLRILKEGNQRFLYDHRIHRNLISDIKATSKEQHPIAVILSCIDSRVPVETIFDMGLGDLFSVRIAGNVINEDVVASIGFACQSGAKLIVILGHTHCGAIRAACSGVKDAYIVPIVNKIQPAIDAENEIQHDRNGNNEAFVYNVTKINIQNTMKELIQRSNIIQQYLESHAIKIVNGIYDVKCGKVVFEENHEVAEPVIQKQYS